MPASQGPIGHSSPLFATPNVNDVGGLSSFLPVSIPAQIPNDPQEADERVELPVDSQVVVDQGGMRLLDRGHPAFPKPEKKNRHWVGWVVIAAIALTLIAAFMRWGLPYIKMSLSTVSTDDAFVAGHITNVGPRIEDVVTEVLVDQNDRVEPGDLLIKLDPIPFQVSLAEASASVDESQARLEQARALGLSQLAQARSNFYKRKNAQEQLREQVATLKARVATLKARESTRWLAQVDQKRLDNLVKQGSATQSELDQRNDTLRNADEQVQVAQAEIQETRAALGLGPNTEHPLDLPKDLEEQQSTIQSAVSDISSTLAQLGLHIDLKNAVEAKAFDEFVNAKGGIGTSANTNEILKGVIERSPGVLVAKATLEKSERDRDDARLKLSYTEVRSEIAGFVQDREVNPGDRVQPGQTLISVRPDYVWIVANFKETQLRYIKIGMPVDLNVDAYPNRVFKGRVSGFSPGTGLSASLLPPENATGNYVKVTQRLPVRIELTEPNPVDTPLFAGLSVVPRVRFEEQSSGPNAGHRLREPGRSTRLDIGRGPAGLGEQTRLRADQGRTGEGDQ